MGDPTHQQHDWEPGIAPSGLAWTIAVSPSAIRFDLKTGAARFHARDLAITDFHDFISAVKGGGPAPVPGHVTFDVRWAGHGKKRKIRDKTFGFSGTYVTGPATITFSASNDGTGVTYTSDPNGQSNPAVAQGGAGLPAIGRERNGVFFH
ncbi:hypothetical protein [Candidatus Solirubrobacter pratensis]|uniref:hypothetical protein n=1 Tax=Candidatus Solirubrobacter pratensis TaxID=1298857 RepID=UPI000418A265|nr:hypothetical protein [Candidatus Solirubrobacter pratensis]